MDSLLERIEENKLDALYLFMTETLRDRTEFDRFLLNLCSVLPHNWSIQRVEVGHEFLSMCETQTQDELFALITSLESLKGLIISDGYIPRKDNGTLCTDSLLTNLPRARNLQYLDIQRLRLVDTAQVELLAEGLECVAESLEEIRITGVSLGKEHQQQQRHVGAAGERDGNNNKKKTKKEKKHERLPSLDTAISVCVEMANLRSLAVSCNTPIRDSNTIISKEVLMDLCQSSTTLQDLALRAMHLDDDTCATIADALITNSFLTSLDIRQNPNITVRGYKAILGSLERNYDLWCSVMVVSSRVARLTFAFLASTTMYAILLLVSSCHSLAIIIVLSIFVLQDNDSFQAKFNSLIELNQANRGDLVRSPTREKLATFLERLQDNQNGDGDPTTLWYFLTIHDCILHPLVAFMKFQARSDANAATEKADRERNSNAMVIVEKRPAADDTTEEDATKRQKLLSAEKTIPT